MGRLGHKVKKIASIGLKAGVGLAGAAAAFALGGKAGGGHDAYYDSPTPRHEEVPLEIDPPPPMGGGSVDVFGGDEWGTGGDFGSSGFGGFGAGDYG